MATFITIGYGDRAGYDQTDPAVIADDARARENGVLWASPTSRSRFATTMRPNSAPRKGPTCDPTCRSPARQRLALSLPCSLHA